MLKGKFDLAILKKLIAILVASFVIFISFGFTRSAFAGPAMMAGGYGPYPCSALSAGSGILNECHYSEYLKAYMEQTQKTWQFAIITGILNAFQYFNQKLATDAADYLLSGGSGKGTAFYQKTFGKYLGDVAIGSANQFLSELNKFSANEWGFNICKPITLSLKLSLGIAKGPALPVADCTFDQVVGNFQNVYRSMQPAELSRNMRQMLQPGNNDVALQISASQKFMEKLTVANQGAILQRTENKGIKTVTDFISGRIKTPSVVALETYANLNMLKIKREGKQFTNSQMIGLALASGIEQLPLIAGSAFVNELAAGALQKFFDYLGQSVEDSPELADLSDADLQSSSQLDQPFKAVGITDFLTPNLITSDKQDFTFELSSCPTPRGPWGCSMDDAMMNGLHSAEKDGGNTVARAAGIGITKGKNQDLFLHKDWELIPEWETKENQDTGCYQRAYCASNLSKLRFARILPIGWELAANSPFNKKLNGKYVTLETVVQNFSNCNKDEQADADHPWCHLINPGWVLTAPAFICQIRGFGDSLLASDAPQRTQECTDVVSCLSSNDKGECVGGFGYCLSEKTAWRFGADACEEKFVSCRTYQPRDKTVPLSDQNPAGSSAVQAVSYIRNTIDYGACSADNIGCLFYYTLRDTSTTTTDRWVTTALANPANTWSSTYGPVYGDAKTASPRVYFDGTVKKCDAANDGCTKMYDVAVNTPALNLVRNSSFEDVDPKDAKKLIGWEGPYVFASVLAENGDSVQDGSRSAVFDAASKDAYTVASIGGLRNYVASYYVRKGADAGAPKSRLTVAFFKPGNVKTDTKKNGVAIKYAISPNCDPTQDAGDPNTNPNSVSITPPAASITSDWQRYTCEFVAPQDATTAVVHVSGSNVVIDAVELEEGVAATQYIAGVNASLQANFLKIAPDELKCTGNTKTDRVECGNYARMCGQTDVGCQGYTDVNGAGGTEIPATLNVQDLCPHSCVGYAEYRKLPSAFDLTKDNAPLDDPADDMVVDFIPKTAKQCSAAVVGCDEFTNIESQAVGGEQKVYLTYARACEKPGAETRTYFTWEGSDTTGYQLRTWSLMRKFENQSADPLYPVETTAPRIILKAGPSGLVKNPATCTESTWKTGIDPDCRQFYDEKGAAYYRYFSQTVLSSPSCRDYRKNESDFADCSKTGGTFNPTTNECVYHIEVAQSNSCTADQASCRGYIGTTGRNTATVISENFAAPSSTGAFYDKGGKGNVKLSNEALLVGDHSLQLVSGGVSSAAAVDFSFSTTSLYTVSFWAKSPAAGQGDQTISLTQDVKAQNQIGITLGSAILSADWKRYEFGPLTLSSAATGTIVFASTAKQTYIDTVNIQRLQDIVYVRKNSWVALPQCDQTIEGVPQPQAMLGCRTYTDRKGQTIDVREFSHLCRYESIGCSAYVNTRNTSEPYSQSFSFNGIKDSNKTWDRLYAGTVTTIHPANRYEYLIDEPGAHCDSTQTTCRSFGQPVFDSNQTVSSTQIQTVYLMDDVSQYVDQGGEPKMLCRPSELFCERYTSKPSSGAVTSYFRDPGMHICEWKDKVPMKNGNQILQTSGWFVKDSSPAIPCYPEKVSSGNTFLFEYAGVDAYRGWTGICPKEQAECTEFRDPSDHTDQIHPLGKPYFYIDNNRIDKASCGNKVDLFSGCVLFRNMNDSQLTYSSKASYAASKAADNTATPVVNCQTDPGNPFCKGIGSCVNLAKKPFGNIEDAAAFIKKTTGASCTKDVECSHIPVDPQDPDGYTVVGTCQINDSNLVLKVKLDRDCTTWLGCTTAETTYDPAQGKYVDLCTNLSACDQSLGATGKNFCAHYVDRAPEAQKLDTLGYKEPILNRGVFLDYLTYTKRPVGFNVPDYSSYAIPNHFQMSDLVSRRVGYELLEKRNSPQRDKFYNDYRLVAAVRLYDEKMLAEKLLSDLDPAGAAFYSDSKYPDLNLCKHKQTGRIGYFVPSESGSASRCYFAIDTPYSQIGAQVLDNQAIDVRDITLLAQEFEQMDFYSADQLYRLAKALPGASCRAYPDANAPFPNAYVKEWDDVSDPPTPRVYVDGYNNVSYCEKGEDCSCSYRKVAYGSVTNKYYSLFGSPPPAGLCVGGSRDGQACVPGAMPATAGGSIDTGNKDKPKIQIEPGGSPSTDLCDGGTCQEIQTVSFVRGQYGQCLEYDLSRNIAGSQNQHPCLIWNPPPVLFGDKDVYHYQPTSGYLPPQNSGEYYCLSSALPPHEVAVPASTDWLTLPGRLNHFEYDENYVSDGDCTACVGSEATFIDGKTAKGGDMGSWCEQADDQENQGNGNDAMTGAGLAAGAVGGGTVLGTVGLLANTGHLSDANAGRWIMTGRDQEHSYYEYFIGFKADEWAKQIFPAAATLGLSEELKRQSLLERRFAYFKFDPIVNPNGHGIIGCGYTPDWVDGVTVDDYDSSKKLEEGDKKWQVEFRKNFKGIMTRESAQILTDQGPNHPVKMKCLNPNNGTESNGYCYYKYWQVGYQDEGQEEFIGLFDQRYNKKTYTIDATLNDNLSPGRSSASRPFFSIRAMFEDTNASDNKTAAEKLSDKGSELNGPFQFVGFWITASVPGTASERAIYMYLHIGNMDTCKEVAQVVSPLSHESAAFTDRVWESGRFSVPLLGYTYSSVNPPFSSAIHTRPIGIDPLFQTHGKMLSGFNKLKAPGFIASGLEYFTGYPYPAGTWSLLNNVFARVYRIYRYYDTPVSAKSSFCLKGPRAGASCDPTSDATKIRDCGLSGFCNQYLVDPNTAPGFCNALSGVNAGLTCTGDTSDDIGGYHVCHNAPLILDPKTGDVNVSRMYRACVLQPGWDPIKDSDQYKNKNGELRTKSQAAGEGAFRCADGSVPVNGQHALCGEPADTSFDCPQYVVGDINKVKQITGIENPDIPPEQGKIIYSGCVTAGEAKGTCAGFSQSRCSEDRHCEFTEIEWWGGYRAAKPWGVDPVAIAVDAASSADYKTAHQMYVRSNAQGGYSDVMGPFNYDTNAGGSSGGFRDDVGGPNAKGDRNYYLYGEDWHEYLNGTTFSGIASKASDSDVLTTGGASWWSAGTESIHGQQFGSEPGSAVGKDMGGMSMQLGGFVRLVYPIENRDVFAYQVSPYKTSPYSADPSLALKMIDRFPGAYAAAIVTKEGSKNYPASADFTPVDGLFIPGHCEKLPTGSTDKMTLFGKTNPWGMNLEDATYAGDNKQGGEDVRRTDMNDVPYRYMTLFCEDTSKMSDSNKPDCAMAPTNNEPDVWYAYQRYFPGGNQNDQKNVAKIGMCDGGAKEGNICNADSDCQPKGITDAEKKEMASWCRNAGACEANVPDKNKDQEVCSACHPKGIPVGTVGALDLDKDDNLCTHNAGYYQRADLCAFDPNKLECLTGFRLLDKNADHPTDVRKESVDPKNTPPTDVTAGWYTADKGHLGAGTGLNYTIPDFSYLAYYAPRPPQIAAPDTVHGCSAGQCPISKAGTFSLEGQAEGGLTYFGGQAVVSMRFYAWAADNQGPLHDMWIDWGDGTVQHIQDAKMKNKKPFCGVASECENVPGLSCGSDRDCPPGAGRCAPTGYCKADSFKQCSKDSDCSRQGDRCVTRLTFGNSDNACEQGFFEFTHAYTCGKDRASDTQCNSYGYCSRDTSVSCSEPGDKKCTNMGDTCVKDTAPPSSCFVQKTNACRFTPRVLIKDNWGWCTGECRTNVSAKDGSFIDFPLGSTHIVYKNGGCYDAKKLQSNVDSRNKLVTQGDGNYCDPDQTAGTNARPWIVYPGAVELGVSQ